MPPPSLTNFPPNSGQTRRPEQPRHSWRWQPITTRSHWQGSHCIFSRSHAPTVPTNSKNNGSWSKKPAPHENANSISAMTVTEASVSAANYPWPKHPVSAPPSTRWPIDDALNWPTPTGITNACPSKPRKLGWTPMIQHRSQRPGSRTNTRNPSWMPHSHPTPAPGHRRSWLVAEPMHCSSWCPSPTTTATSRPMAETAHVWRSPSVTTS